MNQPGPMLINFFDAINDADHYTKPPTIVNEAGLSHLRTHFLAMYTVDRKKRDSTFVIITLEEHTRFI